MEMAITTKEIIFVCCVLTATLKLLPTGPGIKEMVEFPEEKEPKQIITEAL
jgi:hypothetical protein